MSAMRAGSSPDWPAPGTSWSTVALLLLLYILSALDRNLISLMVDEIKAELAISDVQIGWLTGLAFALFYSVGALPLGWAMDRFSRRAVIYAGVATWSLSTAFCGLARSFQTFFAARALVGAGEAVLGPGSQSILPDLFPKHRLALPMSVYAMGAKVGTGVSLIVGGALAALISPSASYDVPGLGTLRGWQSIFVLAGLPGLVIALAIFGVPEPRRRDAAPASTNYRDYLRYAGRHARFFVPHHLAMLPLALVTMGLNYWVPAFMARAHGWETAKIGFWVGVAFAAGPLVFLPLHGVLVDRWFRSGRTDAHLRYLIATLLAGTPFGIAAFLVSSPALAIALIGVFFALITGYVSLPGTILQIVVPGEMRGKAAALLMTLVGVISLATGPVVVAWITEHVFGDPAQVGSALALCLAVGLPLSSLLYALAMKPARALVGSQVS